MPLQYLPCLPDKSVKIIDLELWMAENAHILSIHTLLNTKQPRPDLLEKCLARARFVVRRTKPFHTNNNNLVSAEKQTESQLRREVHDYPNNFTFNISHMRGYHPIHVAEMLQIVLGLLDSLGIDARVQTKRTKRPDLN